MCSGIGRVGGARTRKNAIKGEIREYQKEVELAFAHDRKIHRAEMNDSKWLTSCILN